MIYLIKKPSIGQGPSTSQEKREEIRSICLFPSEVETTPESFRNTQVESNNKYSQNTCVMSYRGLHPAHQLSLYGHHFVMHCSEVKTFSTPQTDFSWEQKKLQYLSIISNLLQKYLQHVMLLEVIMLMILLNDMILYTELSIHMRRYIMRKYLQGNLVQH